MKGGAENNVKTGVEFVVAGTFLCLLLSVAYFTET